jgi:Domain of unknown function (DUF4440)
MIRQQETIMEDARVWEFEEGLWTGSAEHYRALIDGECLMVLPTPPHIISGTDAIAAVSATPRWTKVTLTDGQIARPEEGLIVVAYHVVASRDDQSYAARCTSTYRRRAHEDWQVVQHQQSPMVP